MTKRLPLSETHPHLAAQLVDQASAILHAGSSTSVEWRCPLGHITRCMVRSKTQNAGGCAVCTGRELLVGFNDMRTTHPDLAAQLVDQSIDVFAGSSRRKLLWRCDLGHEYEATGSNRLKGAGCPYCSGQIALPDFNDLSTTHPDLAAQLVNPSIGKSVTRGSNSEVDWRCSLGHEWRTKVVNRAVQGHGCPTCSGRRISIGENDLATTHPSIAAQLADQSLATTLTHGMRGRVEWTCGVDGHPNYEASVHNRCSARSTGCPTCSGRNVIAGVNDFATTHPVLSLEMTDQMLATQLTAGSHMVVEWQCAKGHRWDRNVYGRAITGHGCPTCSSRKVAIGENDLATTNPLIAAELVDQSMATKVSRGSRTSLEWRCPKGHTWTAPVSSRSKGHGCPECNGLGYDNTSADARLYLVSPPGKHPLGYGKVHSVARYDYAMDVDYVGCAQVAFASGDGRSVSSAESQLHAIKDRPVGKMPRLKRESLHRAQESVDAWVRAALDNGLAITWIDRDALRLEQPKAKVEARQFPDRCDCTDTSDGIRRFDSTNVCCKRSRSLVASALHSGHYLGGGQGGTRHTFAEFKNGEIVAVMTLGTGGAARSAKSLSTYSDHDALELTRLWASPELPTTLSSFVSRCFLTIDYPLYVYSYADASEGHTGGIYQACSFNYAGWSDMKLSKPLRRQPKDRSTPFADWPVVSAKHRYWIIVGATRKQRSDMIVASGWKSYDPRILGFAPIDEHRRASRAEMVAAEIDPR